MPAESQYLRMKPSWNFQLSQLNATTGVSKMRLVKYPPSWSTELSEITGI
jgi:hypothetical protein